MPIRSQWQAVLPPPGAAGFRGKRAFAASLSIGGDYIRGGGRGRPEPDAALRRMMYHDAARARRLDGRLRAAHPRPEGLRTA